MIWSEILYLFSCAGVTLYILLFKRGVSLIEFRPLLSASVITSAFPFLFKNLPTQQSQVVSEWSMLVSVTLLLITLALFIYRMKPVYNRFPYPFVYLPFLVLIFYPLISDAEILKDFLNILLQSGALLIFILLTVSLFSTLKYRIILYTGQLLLLLALGVFWFYDFAGDDLIWYWQLPLTAGVATCGVMALKASAGIIEREPSFSG